AQPRGLRLAVTVGYQVAGFPLLLLGGVLIVRLFHPSDGDGIRTGGDAVLGPVGGGRKVAVGIHARDRPRGARIIERMEDDERSRRRLALVEDLPVYREDRPAAVPRAGTAEQGDQQQDRQDRKDPPAEDPW